MDIICKIYSCADSNFVDIAMICVPVMLIVKPVFEILMMKKHEKNHGPTIEDNAEPLMSFDAGSELDTR